LGENCWRASVKFPLSSLIGKFNQTTLKQADEFLISHITLIEIYYVKREKKKCEREGNILGREKIDANEFNFVSISLTRSLDVKRNRTKDNFMSITVELCC